MKDIEYYMSLDYRMEIIPDTEEGGFAVKFPDLPGCLTCGETIEEAIENSKDCRRAWFEAQMESGRPIAEPASLDNYSGQFKLRLPRTLHRDLVARSKAENTSMNQCCVYLLSKALTQTERQAQGEI